MRGSYNGDHRMRNIKIVVEDADFKLLDRQKKKHNFSSWNAYIMALYRNLQRLQK